MQIGALSNGFEHVFDQLYVFTFFQGDLRNRGSAQHGSAHQKTAGTNGQHSPNTVLAAPHATHYPDIRHRTSLVLLALLLLTPSMLLLRLPIQLLV